MRESVIAEQKQTNANQLALIERLRNRVEKIEASATIPETPARTPAPAGRTANTGLIPRYEDATVVEQRRVLPGRADSSSSRLSTIDRCSLGRHDEWHWLSHRDRVHQQPLGHLIKWNRLKEGSPWSRILTRLYAAVAKVNIHPIRSTPQCLVLRINPTVFSESKISSTLFRHC